MSILEAKSIRKEFGTLVAVNDVDLTLEKGQVIGLIGPNGAGKTTLLRILATLIKPTSGTALVSDHDLLKDYLAIRKHIGYLPDFFNLYNDLTLEECLEFFARSYRIDHALIPQKIDTALEQVELQSKRKSFIRHLSRGMIQRMGLATLLVRDPELFLLDEPASGLDPKARIQLRNVLKNLSQDGKTIIISSHILTELSGFCSHIAIMSKGKIIQYGLVDDIRRKISGSKIIRIAFLGDHDQTRNLLDDYPNAKVVNAQDHTITVELNGELEDVAALNTHLVGAGIKVTSFTEEKMGLEELFLQISEAE